MSGGKLIKKKRTRELLFISFLLLPALLIYLAYRVMPLAWNLVLSFQYWSPTKPAEFAGLYHYEEMFIYDDVFWTSFWNTVKFMGVTPIAILLALGIALLVNQELKGRGLYRTIVFMSYPMMVVAVGIIWRWLYDDKVGLINYALLSLGLVEQPISFLESYRFAMASVIVAAIWQIIGFFMIVLLTGLQNIPTHLYEAARIDGANAFQRFYRITLPLLRPALFLCAIIGIIASFTSFDLIYTMTNGGPGRATELMITYIYKTAFTLTEFDYAGALTMAMFVFFVLLALLINLLSGGNAGKVDIAD